MSYFFKPIGYEGLRCFLALLQNLLFAFILIVKAGAFAGSKYSVPLARSLTISSYFLETDIVLAKGIHTVFNTWVNHTHRVDENSQPVFIWGYWKLQYQAEKAVVGCGSREERKQCLIQLSSDAALNN